MKKIVLCFCISLCLCLCMPNKVEGVGSISIVVNNNVEGYIGEAIVNQDVELTLNLPDEYEFIVDHITDGMDVKGWFTNIPSGCNYSAVVSSVDVNKITVTFSGSIDFGTPVSETPINVTIPYVSTSPYIYMKNSSSVYEADLSMNDNTNAKYIIEEHPFDIRYYGPYTVSGYVGEDIGSQDVVVEIVSGGPDAEELDLAAIGEQLPITNDLGLIPTITDYDDTNMLITITYTGIPSKTSNDLIHTTIPATYLVPSIEDRDVPDRNDVRFNIIRRQENKHEYVAPFTGVN